MTKVSAYERVTRNMVINLAEDFKQFRLDMRGVLQDLKDSNLREFAELKATNQELFNHMSGRLPKWITILGTIGGTVLGGLIIFALTH